jgi:hypothetical protein
MIHLDILEYVRHRLSLRSLKAGRQVAIEQYVERNVEFIWVATYYHSPHHSTGVAMLHTESDKVGLVFVCHTSFVAMGKDENGNETRYWDEENPRYTFTQGALVHVPLMQDPVRDALVNLNWLATSEEAIVLGDEPIRFDLYISAIGGAIIYYSYDGEVMKIDDSIQKLYSAFSSVAYTIDAMVKEEDRQFTDYSDYFEED